jgi:nucleoside-diphosphate-sugar epimerase
MDKERVFITGGTGFIGSHVTRLFVDAGDEVVVYDSSRSYISPLVSKTYPLMLQKRLEKLAGIIKIFEGDIRDFTYLSHVLTEYQPHRIIHLAALSIADKANLYPQEAVSVNYNGTTNVLCAMRSLKNVKKFVNISSSMVYGDFIHSPCREDHPLNPREVYGATKLGAENIVRAYGIRFGIPYCIVRPSAVYGPTDTNHRVTQLFVERALKRDPLILHNGGKSRLDFTFIEDLAMGIFLAAKSDIDGETFNLTRGEGRTLKELADIIASHIPGTQCEYRDDNEGHERRPERGAMDISKAKKLLGYNPKYSLEEGMAKYINFFKQYVT